MVYDTGPGLSEEFDTGQAVVVPYLRQQGITRLDTMVVSHGDNDHIGGARSVLRSYPARQVLSSVPDELREYGAGYCRRGMSWQWDEVRFTLLHPDISASDPGNNDSCVLRIETAGGGRVLLTGDIEQETERKLLYNQRDQLAAQVLVVPHHGSNTSSTSGFIEAVAPQFALVPAGYLNRYRFPKAAVTERYRQAGVTVLETGRQGAIFARFSAKEKLPVVTTWRSQQVHFWQWEE
jgi:competence protein ComEC